MIPAILYDDDATLSQPICLHKIYMKISEGFKMPEGYTNSWETCL